MLTTQIIIYDENTADLIHPGVTAQPDTEKGTPFSKWNSCAITVSAQGEECSQEISAPILKLVTSGTVALEGIAFENKDTWS